MIDLISAIGKEAGFDVQIEPIQFSALIPALTGSKIDLIAAVMYAMPVRAQVVDFSSTVITYRESLVVPSRDSREYAALADIKGFTVGAQVGTAYVEPLQKTACCLGSSHRLPKIARQRHSKQYLPITPSLQEDYGTDLSVFHHCKQCLPKLNVCATL